MNAWSGEGADECSILLRMLESLTEIDWQKDSVWAITRNHATNSALMNFLDARSQVGDQHISPADRYVVSKEEALKLEIE